MEKEFVPYEESLKLKNLEFDEPCFAFWDAYNGDTHLFFKPRTSYHWMVRVFNALKGIESKTILDYSAGDVEYEEGDNAVLAPTFSQAFRWFKENYNLRENYGAFPHHTIMFNYVLNGGKEEDAELACLRKLIEIVKEK